MGDAKPEIFSNSSTNPFHKTKLIWFLVLWEESNESLHPSYRGASPKTRAPIDLTTAALRT